MPQYTRAHDRGGNSGGGGSSGVGVNKKKFGKNLNKLVKPAAPPIPSDKMDHNVKNGLLLLSTKKPSSGLLASKTNTTISTNGGIGASGPANKTVPALNFQSQSSPSTHQVLLSAVVGASQSETQQKLDAWGVADQMKEQQQLHYDLSQDFMDEEKSYEERDTNSDELAHNLNADLVDGEDLAETRGCPPHDEGASWDAYGGRGQPSTAQNGTLVETDDQRAYMSRLAKERAQLKLQEEDARFAEQKARAAMRLKDLEQKKLTNEETKAAKADQADDEQRTAGPRTLWDPDGKTTGIKANGKDSSKASNPSKPQQVPDVPDPEPIIHLASYEDRDRGERSSGAAPRMLYDPKSGSMVEVKAKSESSGTKQKKARSKGKKEREPGAPEVVVKNGRSKQKPRKETVGNSQPEKKKANPNRRFPRTRGILYKRDGKGGLRSPDECDGDLGFGAHSVPGGRVRNTEAYVSWVEQNKRSHDSDFEADVQKSSVEITSSSNTGLSLESGFTADEPQPVMEWITADDKIELITGVDDSPTLKPTAKEWAPSVAAIAAAVAAANAVKDGSDDASSLVDPTKGHDETEDEEESDEADDGLGFDPLQGIDFMSSPANVASKTAEEIATVDLPSFTLEPPVFSGTSNVEDSAISRPLFGFGSSATWSSDQANGTGLSGWGAGSGAVGLFGSDTFGKSEQASEAPTFLAGASSSWAAPAVPGLDRLPAINASEHAGPAD